jgi:demethylmenaquinone methyltransferase/2-methoxy-6-polyprenyl-1,4-benzoquinol methylase
MSEAEDTTSFGFREVPAAEKAGMVREVFANVAPRYDLMNDVMSLGVHRIWKRLFLDRLGLRDSERLVDVAGGTGDIARGALSRAPKAEVTLVDVNLDMIVAGRTRPQAEAIDWVTGDAERLPFADKSFDAYTIAFGIRNVTGLDAALSEARRVLKRGGRFYCLEFSTVTVPGLDALYDFYSFKAIPRLGQAITKNRGAYEYLVESIRRFPNAENFAKRIRAQGFANVTWTRLSGGIAAIHGGWRI